MKSRAYPDWVFGLLVAAIFFAVGLLFLYRDAVVEADSVRVAFGIVRGITTGDGLQTRDLYGRTFSFGYYLLFFALYPRFFSGFGPLPAVMNGLNLVSTTLALCFAFLWMRELWGRRIALAAIALLATTPVLFELGGYGHPEGPAFLLLNLALFLAWRGLRPGSAHPGLLLVAAALAAFLATTMRADVLFAFPLFPLAAPLAAGRLRAGRAFAIGLAIAVAATAAFFLAQRAVIAHIPPRLGPAPGGAFTGEVKLASFFLEYWAIAKEVRSLAKGIAVWATGFGPLALAISLGAVVLLAFERNQRRFALAALGVLLPSALFWLPDPTPSRHLLMTFLVLAPAAMILPALHVPGRRFAVLVALFLVLNLIAMDVIYPIVVRNYRFTFVSALPRRTNLWVPMGNPITNRIWASRKVQLELAEARELAASGEKQLFVLGGFVSLRLLYELYTRGPHTVDYVWRHEAFLYQVRSGGAEYLIYDYGGPQQVTPAALVERMDAAGELTGWTIAIVSSDRPIVGAAEVPPGHRAFPWRGARNPR